MTACAGCHGQSCRNKSSSTSRLPSAASFEHDISLVSDDHTDAEVVYDSDVDWISEEIIEGVYSWLDEVHIRIYVELSQGNCGLHHHQISRQCLQVVLTIITFL